MLQNKAMLVDLTIHQWTARKYDKKATTEVETTYSAKNAGRFNKQLVAKSALLLIGRKANELRDFHYSKTLPWSDTGPRLLPSELFMEYRAGVRRLRDEFNALVSLFVKDYPNLIADAQRHLGQLFNQADYPPVSEMYSRFYVGWDITPVPSGSDFRVDMADYERAEIQQDIEQRMAERQSRATRECYVRVKEVLERMKKQCVESNTRVTDAVVSDAHEIAVTLDKLNITGDPELTRLGREMREGLLVGAETLRTDTHIRKEVGDRASELLNSVTWN